MYLAIHMIYVLQVHRLVACDGPLACHAIQGCLHRYVCVCATTISRGGVSHKGELEEWFEAILDTTMDCLGGKGELWLLHTASRPCAQREVLALVFGPTLSRKCENWQSLSEHGSVG